MGHDSISVSAAEQRLFVDSWHDSAGLVHDEAQRQHRAHSRFMAHVCKHPSFLPDTQARGYKKMISDLESMLASLTGFDACSLQPNSGSQGEYSGLRAIQAYQHSVGQSQRNQVLIPESAHGTNPASTMMAGLKPLTIKCLATGYIDLHHLDEMIAQHGDTICAIMITYPSTYGLFEETVRTVIDRVHACGGQVYMDGANMNAQVGLTSPGFLGAD